jgi:hypothetical protein
MATLKFKLDTRRPLLPAQFPLVIRISSLGKTRDIPTSFKIFEFDWDEKSQVLKKSYLGYKVVLTNYFPEK